MARRGGGIYQRSKTWWLDFRHDGRRHVVRLGKGISRSVARELAAVKRAAVLRGEAGIGGPKRKNLDFNKAVEMFLAWAEANKRPKTVRSYRQCCGQLARTFAGKTLASIDPLAIEHHRAARIKAGAPIAANRELATVKALYNRLLALEQYDGPNPAARVRLVRERPGRLRYLEEDEEARLLTVADEPLRTIILTGIHAGLRIEAEALKLRTPDVDLARGLLTVQAAYAKNGETRTVPLNSTLRAALAALRERTLSEHVFAKPDGSPSASIRTAFETACRRAGLEDVTPHTLRHTFASRLAMRGVDLRTIQELGGWSNLDMVQRYSHLSPTHKAEAVERLAAGADFPTLFPTPRDVVALSARRAGVAQWQSS